MPLTQHYRVYKGGLPHAVFRTDYMARLRSLLPSPEGSDPPPETGCVSTAKSVRRPHRLSQPKRLFPEAVGNGPFLTEQNPAEMVGETVKSSQVKSNLFSNNIISTAITTNNRVLAYDN